jgi:RNA polymerase sigma-70 factor (ECF subfamily)
MRCESDMATDDASLLASGGAGFERFYARHERAVLAYFARRVRRADLAADLAAETFARALEGRERLDSNRGPARAWLFGIARHLLADSARTGVVEDATRRRLGMRPVVLADAALERIDALADEPALAALSELPEAQREAVRAYVLAEDGYEQIAAALDCSQSVARQRVSRGLRALRQRLEHQR